MPIRFGEFKRIRAAHAVSRNRFCVAIHELDIDDQFSIILEYDGAFPQPWSRIDVQRNIAGLTSKPAITPGDRPYVAISDEGDVFFIEESGIRTEKIPGAGVHSSDADGSGNMSGLSFVNDHLHAYGLGGQIYRRDDASGWTRLAIADALASRRGTFTFLAPDRRDAAFLGGFAAAEFWSDPEEIEDEMLKAAAAGDLERFHELSKEAERWADQQGIARTPTGLLLHGHDDTWAKVDFGSRQVLNDIFVETPERVWIVGTGGLILLGNAEDGFRDVSFRGDRNKNLLSIAKFQDEMVIASDYALHTFDGHLLSPLKPTIDISINKGVPTPLEVQAVDGVMFYFDYKHGICRFDGEIWDWIDIPSELLERNFTGLPPRP